MLWALEDAPVDDQGQLLVLIALADRAADDGAAAWPSIGWIAERARCSTRTVIRHLHALRDAGLIALGDQRLVEHLPANRRPQVYDIDLSRRRGDTVTPQPDVSPVSPQDEVGVSPVSPLGVSGVSPLEGSGVTGDALWGDTGGSSGVTAVSHKPSLEPSLENRPLLAVVPADAATPAETTSAKADNPSQGRRLPENFKPDQAMQDWARIETPLVGWDQHQEFMDYWLAQPGIKGRKTDWVRTWRNWMRKAQRDLAADQRRGRRVSGSPNPTRNSGIPEGW
jgi:hypothetical protein